MWFKVRYYDQNTGTNESRNVEANSPEQASNILRQEVGGKGISIRTCGPIRTKPEAVLGGATAARP